MAAGGEKLVLAFHYVWYGTPFGPAGMWRGWPGGREGRYNPDLVYHGKRMVDSPNYPLDGPYDSLDPAVIERQFRELAHAGIDVFFGTPEANHALVCAHARFLWLERETANESLHVCSLCQRYARILAHRLLVGDKIEVDAICVRQEVHNPAGPYHG